MKHNKESILSHLRELDYVWVKEPIRKMLGFGEIVGWNVNSSSILRKDYSIERLQEEIDENNLPLRIEDSVHWVNFFKVYLK